MRNRPSVRERTSKYIARPEARYIKGKPDTFALVPTRSVVLLLCNRAAHEHRLL